MDAAEPTNPNTAKLRALHNVLVWARTQAYLGMGSQTMGRLLDDTEYLATLIFAPDPDDAGEFRALLHDIERKYDGFTELTRVYDDAALGRAVK